MVNHLNTDRSRLQKEVDELKADNERLVGELAKARAEAMERIPNGAGNLPGQGTGS